VAIHLVTGPPGNGKSLYSMKLFERAILAGKCVVTNVELADDWAEQLSKRVPFLRMRPRARRERCALWRSRVFVSQDLEELIRVRTEGTSEGRALMILDEAHNWMNSRNWRDQDRSAIVRFFTQHRKLGYDVYLIAQVETMIDNQVRGNFEFHIHVKALHKMKKAGIPLVPIKLFVAVHVWHGVKASDKAIAKRDYFRVGVAKRLYDTMQLTHGMAEEHGVIWLPDQLASVSDDRMLGGAPSAPALAPAAIAVPAADELPGASDDELLDHSEEGP